LKQEYAGRYETNIYKSKVKFLEKPPLDKIKERIDLFNPAYFELSQIFDLFSDKIDEFCLNCTHLSDESSGSFQDVMRGI